MPAKQEEEKQALKTEGGPVYNAMRDHAADDPELGGTAKTESKKTALAKGIDPEIQELYNNPELLNTPEEGLTTFEASKRLDLFGYNELPEKHQNPILQYLSYFWGPMPIMIWLAAIVELVQALLGASDHWTDFAVLLGLQWANGTVAFFEEHNAGNAIAALKASLAPKANVKRDGTFRIVKARELVPGDRIVLQLGGVVPADAILGEGKTLEVDQAALTGESLPVTMRTGDTAKMGSTIRRGEMEAIVSKTGENTFFGRAATMVAAVEQVGRFQQVLYNVMMFLMGLASFLVVIILGVLLADNGTSSQEVLDSVGAAVVLLIASIPIAMQVVATVTMAVGANMLASKKAIVARLSAIEELAGMHTLCSDKTGTLTLNELKLDDPVVFDPDITKERIIFLSALAAKRLDEGQDAIDTCITNKALEFYSQSQLREYEQVDFLPFDPSTKRTEATLSHKTEGKFKVTKGAAPEILQLCQNRHLVEAKVLNTVNSLADRGYRALGVAVSDQKGQFTFKAVLSLFDPPRIDTEQTIKRAQEMGVQVKMITGDHTAIAIETARRLGMGSTIHSVHKMRAAENSSAQLPENSNNMDDMILAADGFAEVLPEDKYKIVEVLQNSGQVVGMTGDGVNDAPALKKAQIGIAVEGSTDAARAAADIVLTEPGLSVIIDAMQMSRKIFQRVRNYCIFRISGTIQLIFFFFVAVFFSPKKFYSDTDINNFRLPVLAVVLITLVNDACVLTISRDNVNASKDPQAWHLKEVFIISAVLGFTACAGTILILLAGLHAGDLSSQSGVACIFFQDCKCGSFGQLQALIFLQLCLSDFVTVFAARTRSWFFCRRPGTALCLAGVLATFSTTFLSSATKFGGMKPLSWYTTLMCWTYCIVFFLVQDILKVITYQLIFWFKIVDREAYLNLVKTKPKQVMDVHKIRKFSQDIRASLGGTRASMNRASKASMDFRGDFIDIARRASVGYVTIPEGKVGGSNRFSM